MLRIRLYVRRACLAAVAFWIGGAALTAVRVDAGAAQRRSDASTRIEPTTITTDADAPSRALIDRYCVTCHSERVKTGGLSLEGVDVTRASADADTWEKVIRKLRGGMMPPAGMPRPDQATLNQFLTRIESALDEAARRAPYAGRVGVHRMNRAEYANAIRDLLDLRVDVAELLPPDGQSFGFDNMADALTVSPALLERYLSAAQRISALAVGDSSIAPVGRVFRVRGDLSQDAHVEGLPLGTRGGLAVEYTFPLDGEYTFKPKLWRAVTDIPRGMETETELQVLLDGEVVHAATFGGKEDDRRVFESFAAYGVEIEKRFETKAHVTAGPHVVGVTFVNRGTAPRLDVERPFLKEKIDPQAPTGMPELDSVTVSGPFSPTGPGITPSRQAVFLCRPTQEREAPACADRILSTLARRAYRGPVSAQQLHTLREFYQRGRRDGGSFDAGIESALTRLLASPEFLFRVERAPAGTATGAAYPVDDVTLASRLSFFLWSSIPDDELLTLAAQGRLSQPAVLRAQVRRMLADARSAALVTNFLGQWLYLRNLDASLPDPAEFTDFDGNLRQAMLHETELFFRSILDEDRSALELLTADYTFVNERLARHYGITGVYGETFRRVTLSDARRRGLLGQASVLTVSSLATRTSPVQRGKYVLSNLLGTPPPPPPPNVPDLKDKPSGRPLSMRERMEEHRRNAACASCHRVMDPIGLSLEHFDAIGRWRDDDGGAAIDASGQLADGTPIDGASGLRAALASRGELFVRTVTQNLLTYAVGRGLDARDMPAVRGIVRDAAASNYRLTSLVYGIVTSAPFRMSTKERDTPVSVARAAAN